MNDTTQISDLQRSSPIRLPQHPEIAKFPRPEEVPKSPGLSIFDLVSPIPNNDRETRGLLIPNDNILKDSPFTNGSPPHQIVSSLDDESSRRAYLLQKIKEDKENKENNMNNISTSLAESLSQDSMPVKTVSWNMFVGVTILFIIGLAGLFAWQAALIVKVVNLESELFDNIEHTRNLEDYIVADIENGLSANIAKTNNLQNIVIPGMQSDLLTNINKANNVETDINKVSKVYFGITPTSSWIQYSQANGVYQDVDITRFGFKNPPIVLTCLLGDGANYLSIGTASIYSITKTTFRVYVKWWDSLALTPTDTVNWNWRLQYALLSTDP